MIRYAVTPDDLERQVKAESKDWLTKAKAKTDAFRKAGKYDEKEGSWSEIKGAYMAIQHGKCAYCERKSGKDAESRIEHDVEHFRPKSQVRSWPPKSRNLHYPFPLGQPAQTGYHLLAYSLFNYAVTCKKCNTTYKSDFFPIAGAARIQDQDDPRNLSAEDAFLIYPIGDLDDDPEDLITFQGLIAMPKHASGPKQQRARVTIDFFKLDIRDELLFQRAVMLKALYWALDDLAKSNDPKRRKAARQTVDLALDACSPHTSCARAFHALYQSDPQTADAIYDLVYAYLEKKGY
jgi:5-methylcytosine-specific restriction endonuclease McrA